MEGSLRGGWRIQLLSYAGAGVLAAIVDLSSFWLLTAGCGLHALWANPLSRTLGGWTCFLVNKVWTFQQGLAPRFMIQAGRFWVIFLVSTLGSQGLLAIATIGLGIPDLAAKAGVEAIIFLFNFVMLRSWAFR